MVSSFPLPGCDFRVERYEAQRDARRAAPRLMKERDKLMVAPRQQRRKTLTD
jgi:hypothetical protein